MLKKLRWKFIIINMSLVSIVLFIVFLTLYISNYQKFKYDSTNFLARSINQPSYSKSDKQRYDIPHNSKVSAFIVILDEDLEITQTIANRNTLNSLVYEAVNSIDVSKKDTGVIQSLNLRYLVKKTKDGFVVGFTDISKDKEYLLQLITYSIIIAVGGLIAFFLISLYLSTYALRPVEKAWKAQQQFVADASHELKTPLTVMLANTSILLSSEEPLSKKQTKWIRYIETEACRMQKLVKDLLFLAKSDESKNPIVKTLVGLHDIVENCVLLFEPVAFESGLHLDYRISSAPTILGHVEHIKQMLMILLDNAVKYSEKNGRIIVSLESISGKAVLTVNNTGKVIPKKEIGHIFDRFYRVDEARNRQSESYGLGLSIAKEIVKSHKGRIDVESTTENGTTFIIQLPIKSNN